MTTIRRSRAIESSSAAWLLLMAAVVPLAAAAMPTDPPSLLAASCGVIQMVEGEVQVLDESRTSTHEARRNETVPCGAWISATRGTLGFRHVDGHVVQLAAGAFVQVSPAQKGDPSQPGGLVLFKGMLYVKASETGPELSLLTSNGRISFEPGAAGVALWDESQEETQLLSLGGTSRFENRFQEGSSVRVAAGEASSLNFKLLRVLPMDPAPMPVENVKLKIAEFRLDSSERELALAAVERRAGRQVLANLAAIPSVPETPATAASGLVTRVTEDKEKGRLLLEEKVEPMDGSEVAKLPPTSEGVSRELRSHAELDGPANVLGAGRAPASSSRSAGEATGSSVSPAGVVPVEAPRLNLSKASDYRRHPEVDDEDAARQKSHLARRLAGGGAEGEELEGLLNPDDYKASSGKATGGLVEVVEADRPGAGGQGSAKVSSRDEQERRRLLSELSKLKPEP